MQGKGTTSREPGTTASRVSGALSAREILRREYGSSRNLMTPHVIVRGKLAPAVAYELSWGHGILDEGSRLYGVSVVGYDEATDSTERDYDASGCFSSLPAANAHIEGLRSPRCTTCGRPADDGYVNEAAGERCVDPVHSFGREESGSCAPKSGAAARPLVQGEERRPC